MEEMEEEPQEETFKEEVSENNQPLQQQPLRKKRKLALPKRGNKLTDADLPFGVMEGEQRKRKRAKREDNEKQVGEEENWGGEWAEGEEKLQKLRDTWYSSLVFPRIASSKSSIAVWNPGLGFAMVEKEKGKELKKMGFTLKAYTSDKFSYSKQCLYLEDAIFLADKRALFLKWRDGPSQFLSLQECYGLLTGPPPASPSLLASFISSDLRSPDCGGVEMSFKSDYQPLNLNLDIEIVAAFATLKRFGYVLRRHNPGKREQKNQNHNGERKQDDQPEERDGWNFEGFLKREFERDSLSLFNPPLVTEGNPRFRGWWSSFHSSQPSWPYFLQPPPYFQPLPLPMPPQPEFSFLPFPSHLSFPSMRAPLLSPSDYGLRREDVEKKIRIISPLYPSTSPSPYPPPPPPLPSPSSPSSFSPSPSPSPSPSSPPLPPSLSKLIHFDVFEANNFHGKAKAYSPSFYLIFSKVMDQPLPFDLLSRLIKEQTIPVVVGLVEPGSLTFINPTLQTRAFKGNGK